MAKVKLSNAEQVAIYMQTLQHPMLEVIEELRKIIKESHPDMEEIIAWNAPTYNYTGEMKSFNPKEYKRYIVGFNIFKKDCIRLIFLTGSKLTDTTNILEGDYKDGRRLVLFENMEAVLEKQEALQGLIKEWILLIER
jgi:hypothetical protein